MVCICGVAFAIAGLLGLLMLYLVYLAMHVGEPVRPRAAVETSTTTSDSPIHTSLHPRRYTTAVPAGSPFHFGEERLGYNVSTGTPTSSTIVIAVAAFIAACMLVASVAYFVLRYWPPGCSTPNFHKCDAMQWGQHGGRRRSQWYYIVTSFGEHCLQWNPEQVACLNMSEQHFESQADCREACEIAEPSPTCDSGVSETMVGCRDPRNADVVDNSHWWFYDTHLRSCQNWTDVCIDNWFSSLEQCAYMCLPYR
ncbi:hypothetical protein HPB52_007067 [Rhipicephalus sanguineus]|uniref:Uncharacterized protein n=1 Tax=Rhipicephalus sanguineus TaxID=34632 RepID=A0A9D4T583_RHISA|nr:hypothetical protein HPB52_007067 [Rhipicephalus sanguineus]